MDNFQKMREIFSNLVDLCDEVIELDEKKTKGEDIEMKYKSIIERCKAEFTKIGIIIGA